MSRVDNEAQSSSVPFEVVILAAGRGSRLGRPFPKALVPLIGGGTILDRQRNAILAGFGPRPVISAVVGFGADLIGRAAPDVRLVHNERWPHTDTAHSLHLGLRAAAQPGVLWLHGDLVFDPAMLTAMTPCLDAGESCLCVGAPTERPTAVGCTVDPEGHIHRLANRRPDDLGEAIGIGYVAPADRARLIAALSDCAASDRAEHALAVAVGAGMRLRPVDVTGLSAIDVDVEADLRRAEAALRGRAGRLPAQRDVRFADGLRR